MIKRSELPPSNIAAAKGSQVGEPRRGPPKAIQLLLPIWGVPFIAQFLQVSLPTLLAPGNLPALANALPCKFIFLTDSQGAELLRTHAAVKHLQTICMVDVEIIDDLITGDNYSTTITLAYARAVRAAGEEMLDTCFFFMISDYIIADGSLGNVLAQMQAGYSGIFAGNFQVVEEDAKDAFFKKFESLQPSIAIKSRDLMYWAMNYLHPMTIANTVNFPLSYSSHSNRLFWRVDENTLIGRFYLMHMICIRPETADFEVGSSCDYSFMPEMCPSGNIHVMVDSDDYLVVEMQRRAHERRLIKLGQMNKADLASSLAEWTTERHRLNAHFPVVFHAADRPSKLGTYIIESGKFIEEIEAALPLAQPYRGHPYWVGAIAGHRREVERRQKLNDPSYIPTDATNIYAYSDFLYGCRDFVFGRPPHVRPWHPRWSDYRMFERLIIKYFGKDSGRTLVLSSTPDTFRSWVRLDHHVVESLNFYSILELNAEGHAQMVGKFGNCLLVLRETEIPYVSRLLQLIGPLLSVDDHILVFVLNGHGFSVGKQFTQDMVREITGFLHPSITVESASFVAAGWSTWAALRGIRRLFVFISRRPIYIFFAAVPLGILSIFSLAGNIIGRRVGSRPPSNELCSSVGVAMRVATQPASLPANLDNDPKDLEIAGQRFNNSHQSSDPISWTESV